MTSTIFQWLFGGVLALPSTQNVFSLSLLTVLCSLLGHLLWTIFSCYRRLFCRHSLAVTSLQNHYTVRVVVLTDFEAPPNPPEENEDEEKPPLKKSSLSKKEEKALPPLDLPPFLLLKKLLKKSPSSLSKPFEEKNLAKRSSASLKLKCEKDDARGPSKP